MSDSRRKRVRGIPTGSTPKQPEKRRVSRVPSTTTSATIKGRKKLSFSENTSSEHSATASTSTAVSNVLSGVPGSWTAKEERALVEFIMLSSKGDCWPTTISEKFWEAAASFVSQRCNVRQRTCKFSHRYKVVTINLLVKWSTSLGPNMSVIIHHTSTLVFLKIVNGKSNEPCYWLYSGGACRSRVTVTLQKKYTTPEEAEKLMCVEPEVADTPFSLSTAIQNMEIADHPVSRSTHTDNISMYFVFNGRSVMTHAMLLRIFWLNYSQKEATLQSLCK